LGTQGRNREDKSEIEEKSVKSLQSEQQDEAF
jgi:hypothetical protein